MNKDINGHESKILYTTDQGDLCEECCLKLAKEREQEMMDSKIDDAIELDYEGCEYIYILHGR